jgi:hypothetical protein
LLLEKSNFAISIQFLISRLQSPGKPTIVRIYAPEFHYRNLIQQPATMSEEKDIEKTSQNNGPSTSSGQMQVSIEKGDTHLVCNAGGTADGSKVHPQPTTDPLDPLNWSTLQKHVILAIVMFKLVHFNFTQVPWCAFDVPSDP